MKKIAQYLLVVFLVLVAACSTLPTHKDDFTKANEDFLLRVRWLDFPGASTHFKEDIREDFIERFDDVDDLKVTAFSMVRLNVDVPEEKVTVFYRLEYYMLPSATVKKKRFSLTWEQLPFGGSKNALWRITEAFPTIP